MPSTPPSRWIKFLRNYGPIPTNDNMYDETIQRALGRLKIEPLVLPAQFLDQVLTNLRSDNPSSEILTGTAGDGLRSERAPLIFSWNIFSHFAAFSSANWADKD